MKQAASFVRERKNFTGNNVFGVEIGRFDTLEEARTVRNIYNQMVHKSVHPDFG